MKAIETQWKGYRFRSRLEARWAVFFDVAGLDWEYEPEGYDLGPHGWYLPDFFMNHNGGRGPIVEIKPMFCPMAEIKLIEACSGARDGAGAYGAFIYGSPGKEKWHAIHKDGFRDGSEDCISLIEFLGNKVKIGIYEKCVNAARAARFEHGETPA